MPGALPTFVVIGAMKCGTTALHGHLSAHPDISVPAAKEINFFSGPAAPPLEGGSWHRGQWYRGTEWYASLFDADRPVRGEASPGYTSPDHVAAAARMAATLPRARLVYLVRDPVDRAMSQYAHHCRDGTERRPLEEAVLDPASQYVARSRYWERLQPFLDHFPAEQVLVVAQERLLSDPERQLSLVLTHIGADPDRWRGQPDRRVHVGAAVPQPTSWLRAELSALLAEDVQHLRAWLDDALVEWSL